MWFKSQRPLKFVRVSRHFTAKRGFWWCTFSIWRDIKDLIFTSWWSIPFNFVNEGSDVSCGIMKRSKVKILHASQPQSLNCDRTIHAQDLFSNWGGGENKTKLWCTKLCYMKKKHSSGFKIKKPSVLQDLRYNSKQSRSFDQSGDLSDSSVRKTASLLWYRGEYGLISEPGTVWFM